MEKETKNPEIKEFHDIGNQIEKRILEGESVFLPEKTRVTLRNKITEKGGTILAFLDYGRCEYVTNETTKSVSRQQCDTGHDDFGDISMWVAQTYFLKEMLNPERFVELVSGVVADFSKDKEKVKKYLELFLTNQMRNNKRIRYSDNRAYNDGKSDEVDLSEEEKKVNKWKIRAMQKAVAVISATFRLLEVINAGMEAEAMVLQDSYPVVRDFSERVIRGHEKQKNTRLTEPKRVKEDEIIFSFPPGTVGLILERLIVS